MEAILFGMVIGTIYGRNARAINRRTYADLCQLATVLARSQMGVTTFYVLEAIVRACERPGDSCMKSILCECRRRRCPGRTVSADYYARKLKGAV